MSTFLFWVAVAVVGGLIVVGVVAAINWLQVEDNRITLRQRLCRHDWQRYPEEPPGSPLVVIRIDEEECRKCGATR